MEKHTMEQLVDMAVEKHNKTRSEEKSYGMHYDLGNGKAIRFIGFEEDEAEPLFSLINERINTKSIELYPSEQLLKEIDKLKVENAELHCEIQAMNVFAEGIPTEPIKVADMLIENYMSGYMKYVSDFRDANAGQLIVGNPCEKVRKQTVSHIRQIAQHLMMYCNSQKEILNEE
ncbi:MAG: hypothetical protein NC548_62140 [Lachnospiraceae bacterium]|nr:hypothetical protein [Lachnospiraceae bacterium]